MTFQNIIQLKYVDHLVKIIIPCFSFCTISGLIKHFFLSLYALRSKVLALSKFCIFK